MTNFFNSAALVRNVVGMFAALLIGGTMMAVAAGPAAMASGVNYAQTSDIVRVA